MPKIKHLAIRTEDPGKLAAFYMNVFEMQELHRAKEEGGAIFLTDGYFNLAILPNHEQNAPNGLYHLALKSRAAKRLSNGCQKSIPTNCPKRGLMDGPTRRPAALIRTATTLIFRSMAFQSMFP